MILHMGNRDAVEHRPHPDEERATAGEHVRVPLPGKRCTTVEFPDSVALAEAFLSVTNPQGVWAAHSDAERPAWVASDSDALASLLAEHYGCERRDPDPGV